MSDELRFPPGWPEDYKDYVKRNMEEQQLQASAHQHNLVGLFETLDKEQLNTFLQVMNSCENDHSRIAFFVGLTMARLDLVHGQCAACGANHAEEIVAFQAGTTS